MRIVNDIDLKLKEEKKKYITLLLLFVIVSIIVLSIVLTLLLTSSDNYTLVMIINMVITIIYLWFTMFYFININPSIRAKYLFFKNYNQGEVEKKIVTYISKKEETKKRNLFVILHKVSFIESGKTYYRDIYLFEENNVSFKKDRSYRVYLYKNVLIKFEELEDETNE